MTDFEGFLRNEHTGKANAVLSSVIEHRFGCKGTEVRRMVNDLRCRGVPICSCAFGYYYGANDTEIKRTVSSLTNRIKKIQSAVNGMSSCLKKN